jgi:superfamily II DNA or RNA helicase
MNVRISNDIIIENPSREIIDFCTNELVVANPEYFKKESMGFYLKKDVPMYFDLYTTDGNKIHVPYGVWSRIKDLIPPGTPIETQLADSSHVDYKGHIPLWDYQEEAVKIIETFDCGILQSPCGSGKTQMAVELALQLGKKTLWLTHTKDLLDQSYERASRYVDESLLGTITNGKVNVSEGITFATVQTMYNLDLQEYRYTWDVLIVDECHRVAGTPSKWTMFSKVINNLAARRKYGLSATVERADGLIKCTFALLGEVIHKVPEEAVADRTMNVTVMETRTGVVVSKPCQNTNGTINYTSLVTYLAEHSERTMIIAKKIYENKDETNIILSARLQHLKDIIECLKALGATNEEIRMIDGSMVSKKKKMKRHCSLEDMKLGKAKYFFATYKLAQEGLDIPNLNRLYMTIPIKSKTAVLQAIGRLSRTSNGKTDAICFDFVDEMGYCVGAWKTRKSFYKYKKCTIIEVAKPAKRKPDKSVLKTLALTKF